MPTKPTPVYRRWLSTPEGKERAVRWWLLVVLLLNVFIAFGLVAFFLFLFLR